MNKYLKFIVLSCAVLFMSCNSNSDSTEKNEHPNIIFIYADDLGYGDISCYGAIGVKTPNIDYLANNGIRFTDSHSSAATCTPSRYALLTGSYAFRNDAAILPGDAPLILRPGTPTLPEMLKKAGYTTGIVGKWHLGLGDGNISWNDEIKPGPLELGFDYSYIIPATLDRVPTVFVKNHRVDNLVADDTIEVNYDHKIGDLPTGLEHPEMLKMRADTQHSGTIVNGISRIGYMKGGESAWWKDEDISLVLAKEAEQFIEKNKKTPFFLYYSTHNIHVPRAPHEQFVGKSTMGRRGDVIAEFDWMAGEIMKTLKKYGLEKNTLIVLTSDNGPVLDDGYFDDAEKLVGKDTPWGPYNGGKYSAFEGGTRMPTIIYWPNGVKTGVSDALFSQVDFYASLAKLTGLELSTNEAPDSYDMLDVITGKSDKGRDNMLEEAYTFALRSGNWKYIAPQTKPTPDWLKNKSIPTGLSTNHQLYNLETDIAEQKNLADSFPDRVKEMASILDEMQQEKGTRQKFGK